MTAPAVWRLYTYDVWGNAEDGYEVNDVYHTGITVHFDRRGDEGIVAALERKGVLVEGKCEEDQNGYSDQAIYIVAVADGKPVCELRMEV